MPNKKFLLVLLPASPLIGCLLVSRLLANPIRIHLERMLIVQHEL